MPRPLQDIATNVITGFLGIGKTTAILHLLQHKPAGEKWAVLVNEFGKVGIDGQLLQQSGVTVHELAGGCMCCAAGASMQVAVNALLAAARPDRLLIEPTGIGHPRQIIRQLLRPPFDYVLDMRACLCLIDPRHLSDARYLGNDYYQEQLQAADVLVANKTDAASEAERRAFEALVRNSGLGASGWVEQGRLDPAWLDLPNRAGRTRSLITLPVATVSPTGVESVVLQVGENHRREENQGAGAHSCGWRFANEMIFDEAKLRAVFASLGAARIKATLRTDRGDYAFNGVDGGMAVSEYIGPMENRAEVISWQPRNWQAVEAKLLHCTLAGG